VTSTDGRIAVLHLIKGLDIGGAEQLVSLLCRRGDRERFAYSAAFALAGADQLAGELRDAGVAVFDLGAAGDYDLRWAGRLRRLLVEGCYDVVHLHLPYTAGIGRLVAWSLGPARRPLLVQTQHDVWDHTRSPTRMLSRVTWWMDDADLVVSQAVQDSLPRRLVESTEVLRHGIELHDFIDSGSPRALREELGVDDGEVVVVTVANYRAQKGYEVLFAAAKMLLSEGHPVRFAVVGHGPLEAEIRALHQKMALGDGVILLGLRRDVPRILAGADIFVLASHHEGLPLAVMEAFAAGLPVVVTGVGELPRVVRDGQDGLVVPPADPAALAAALRSLIVDDDRRARMTAAARDSATRFDISVASARLEELYESLVAARRRR